MKYFPIFANLKNKSVLIIGNGETAARKAQIMCKFGANVKIIGDNLCQKLKILVENKKISFLNSIFEEKYLLNVFIVIAATNNNKINKKIFMLANKHMKLVNVVDDQSKCSFIFPSIVERKSITIAISSDGKSPVLVKLIREKLEILLPQYIGKLAKIAGKWRNKIKTSIKNINDRRKFWEKIFSSTFVSQVAAGNIFLAEKVLEDHLNSKEEIKGEVFLIGAGPGNSELLTIKALQIMQSADIVLYDNLITKEILNLVRRDAKLICVGKSAGQIKSFSQDKINQMMINLAKLNNRIVRLKGGDPFIFGRGGEELEALKKANINFQVIPGITAAIGASSYSGIPLTHRNLSHSVIFITGHSNKKINWKYLSQEHQTIVIYMGILKIIDISFNLIKNNFNPTTPVAIISNSTQEKQKIFISNIQEISKIQELIKRPGIIIIGEVVKLHKKLNWFKKNLVKIQNNSSIINLY